VARESNVALLESLLGRARLTVAFWDGMRLLEPIAEEGAELERPALEPRARAESERDLKPWPALG